IDLAKFLGVCEPVATSTVATLNNCGRAWEHWGNLLTVGPYARTDCVSRDQCPVPGRSPAFRACNDAIQVWYQGNSMRLTLHCWPWKSALAVLVPMAIQRHNAH